ncbi:MAG: SCP2 sterol-binding domain-containing protein [Azospirillaceae bacterium]|nr:SCP2 sterol-binding domain-containing protein [Azospirillaceae bacterium]
MSLDPINPPPLSPLLLAGLLLGMLPPLPLGLKGDPLAGPVAGLVARLAFARLRRRKAAVFQRLGVLGEKAFLIDPADLPVRLLLRPAGLNPGLFPVADGAPAPHAAATIRAPLAQLLALLEGKIDGDSLFFSRQLMIEGDMEAVLILRNAVDGAGIDLRTDLGGGGLMDRLFAAGQRRYDTLDRLLHVGAGALRGAPGAPPPPALPGMVLPGVMVKDAH